MDRWAGELDWMLALNCWISFVDLTLWSKTSGIVPTMTFARNFDAV